MEKKVFSAASIGLLLSLFTFYTLAVSGNAHDNNETKLKSPQRAALTYEQEENDVMNIDHAALLKKNPDYIGWLDIPGTAISYPMVQAADNKYYISRTFAGESNKAGSIFLDFRSARDFSGMNTVIYGHAMRNGTMFTTLKEYMKNKYCEENTDIRIYTPEGSVLVYKIFAAYETDIYSDCFTFYDVTGQARGLWLASMLSHSWYNFGVELAASDKVITLVTCVGGKDKAARYVVQAVRIG